jgi:spore germination protein YaaH
MAGVKVTDLTTLGTADAADIMYIVDTSANQSKQIEVQNLYAGMPQFESGSFTPTITDEVDCTVTPIQAFYQRVDNVVNCSYFLQVDLDTGETNGTFNLSLPVASNFTQPKQLFGIVAHNNNPTELVSWNLSADTTNDKCTVSVQSVSTAYGYQFIYIVAQYEVL